LFLFFAIVCLVITQVVYISYCTIIVYTEIITNSFHARKLMQEEEKRIIITRHAKEEKYNELVS